MSDSRSSEMKMGMSAAGYIISEGWRLIRGALQDRKRGSEEQKSNTHGQARKVLWDALNAFGYNSNHAIEAIIPKALDGEFESNVFRFKANPPPDYDQTFGTGDISDGLEEAALTLNKWHQGRKGRPVAKGTSGDLKDRAAWTLYETLRGLAKNIQLQESTEGLCVIAAVSDTAETWSRGTSDVGRVGFWREHFGGDDSLCHPLKRMRENLRKTKENMAKAITKKSATTYIENLKRQQNSTSRELVYTMLRGLSDHEVDSDILNKKIDEIDPSTGVYCTFLHAVGRRLFQGELTPAEKALIPEPSTTANQRELLKFIEALEKPDAAFPGEESTLIFIRNLEKISFTKGMAHYSNGTNYSIASGISASFHSDVRSLDKAFIEFRILAKYMVALNETIKLQEKIIDLGREHGDVWMYGGAWKTLSALLPLTPSVLESIDKSVNEFIISGNRAYDGWTKHSRKMPQRDANLAHVSKHLRNLAVAKSSCKKFVDELEMGLARYYDRTVEEPDKESSQAISAAANKTAELFTRTQRLGRLYERMGIKSNIATLSQPPATEAKSEEKPSSPPPRASETKSVPSQVFIVSSQKIRNILMEGVLGNLVKYQKSPEKTDELKIEKWLRGKKREKDSFFACKNIWKTSTGKLRKGPEATMAFLNSLDYISRAKDGLYVLRHSRGDAELLRTKKGPEIKRHDPEYKLKCNEVTDTEAQASLLLLGAFCDTFPNKVPEEERVKKLKAWLRAITNIVELLPLPLLQKIKPDVDKITDTLELDSIPWSLNKAYKTASQSAATHPPAQHPSPSASSDGPAKGAPPSVSDDGPAKDASSAAASEADTQKQTPDLTKNETPTIEEPSMRTTPAPKPHDTIPTNSNFDEIEKLVIAREYDKIIDMLRTHMSAVVKNLDLSGKKNDPVNIIVNAIKPYVDALVEFRIKTFNPFTCIWDEDLKSRLQILFFLFDSINTYLNSPSKKTVHALKSDYYKAAEALASVNRSTLRQAINDSKLAFLETTVNVLSPYALQELRVKIEERDTKITGLEKEITTLKETMEKKETEMSAKLTSAIKEITTLKETVEKKETEMSVKLTSTIEVLEARMKADMKAQMDAQMKVMLETIQSRQNASPVEVRGHSSSGFTMFRSQTQPSGLSGAPQSSVSGAGRSADVTASNPSAVPLRPSKKAG